MNEAIDFTQLNQLFGSAEDPWHMRGGWESERRRDLLLASIARPRYESAFEPGCGSGELTVGLARRADQLLAVDHRRDSVTAARERTAHLSNVQVDLMQVPARWPDGPFDLVVLNELGYPFSSADWAELAAETRRVLSADATVLVCHRHENFAGRVMETETLHGILDSVLGLPRRTRVLDSEFAIDVWTTKPA